MDILFYAAVIPGIFLVWYVYEQDKIEKEPTGLLLRLGFWGAVGVFVAMLAEAALGAVLDFFWEGKDIVYLLIENFLCVALVEEYVKYRALKKTWQHPAFDYRFDAIVYAVAAGMGFAILENIFYVYEHGMSVAMMRACTSLPGHCIFAIYMGYYYGEAKLCESLGNLKGMQQNLRQALRVPVLLHGFYDFCLSSEQEMLMLVFLIFVVILDIRAYKKLKAASRADLHL